VADNPNRQTLEDAIAAQEQLRGSVPDAVVDATIAALRRQIDELLPPTPVEQRRRLVTILFMDIVGSTDLIRDLDPEDSMAILDTALQELSVPIRSHGGRVTRYMGDGFLAVFGLEKARENEAEMAVRAGIGLCAAADTVRSRLERERNLSVFGVRIGINTGLVVSGGTTEAEGTIMGAAVNLAARLESAAPPGRVLISSATRDHVQHAFDLAPAGTIEAKGFSQPVAVFLVENRKRRSAGRSRRAAPGLPPRLVGRNREMQELTGVFGEVSVGNTVRFVTVVGEAGLGKTRLVEEFARWVESRQDPVALFTGRGTPETTDLPYALLRDLLAIRFQVMEDDHPDVVNSKLARGFGVVPAEADRTGEHRAAVVGALLGFSMGGSGGSRSIESSRFVRTQALLHLVDYFRGLGLEGSVVVILDDIQWADDSSLQTVRTLATELAASPVLFVALARPEFLDRHGSWSDEPGTSIIRLSPLGPDDAEELAGDLLRPMPDSTGDVRDLVIRSAGGNPYYLEELIRMLTENEVITPGDERSSVNPDRLAGISVPPTLAGVIQARLDALPEDERMVLQQASIVGPVFWDAVLRHVQSAGTGQFSGAELRGLESRQMIYRHDGSVIADAVEFVFSHSILRDVTYESVLRRVRKTYHGLIADWLIDRAEGSAGDTSGLIAAHLEKAGRGVEALPYLTRAARAAAQNYAVEESSDFYRRALELLPSDSSDQRFELLMEQEEILRVRGEAEERQRAVELLVAMADQIRDPVLRSRALIRKAWLCFTTGEFDEMVRCGNEATDLASSVGNETLAGQGRYAMAWAQSQLGSNDEADEHARKALALAKSAGEPRDVANCFNVLGLIRLARGDYHAAREHLTAFRETSRSIADRERELTALSNLGVALTVLGDYAEARACYEEVRAASLELGDRSLESTASVNLAWVAACDGDWADAITFAERGIHLGRVTGRTEPVAEALLWYGHALAAVGREQEALDSYRQSLSMREELQQPYLAMGVHAALARLFLSTGDLASASDHADRIHTYLAEGGSLEGTWEPFRIRFSCYQVLAATSDPRAPVFLDRSVALLRERSTLIPEGEHRRMYLESVPWHRAMLSEWESERGL
jgi:class 3 adenylate cyclase/tetratricopeptide (TPR) repeat protein